MHFISAVREMFNRTSMKCVHSSVCCSDTRGHFSLSACCQKCCGTPQRDNTGKSGKRRQTGLFATLLTNTHTHTLRFIPAGGGFEAVANCPASWARPRRASSVPLFDAGWVINLDKSFSGSRLMCPQHQHTCKHAIHIYHNSSQRRAWGRPERVNRVNAEKIVSRCARSNLCDRTIGDASLALQDRNASGAKTRCSRSL